MKRSTKKQLLSLFILFAFLGSSITYAVISAVPPEEIQSNWRSLLVINIYNQQYPIPAGIGITDNKTSKLFTNNNDGMMYKTGTEDVTVGDFFLIWGKNFNQTCILEHCNDASGSMRMYVNNVENFEYDFYKIKNGDYILIDYRQTFTLSIPNTTNSTSSNTSALNSTA
jgi:hypothetical protein